MILLLFAISTGAFVVFVLELSIYFGSVKRLDAFKLTVIKSMTN